jgi:hypothetical protein
MVSFRKQSLLLVRLVAYSHFIHHIPLLDRVDDLHAAEDLAENRMLAIQPRRGTCVMKNCEPLVLGPLLAIDRMPGPLWRRSLWNSSANL